MSIRSAISAVFASQSTYPSARQICCKSRTGNRFSIRNITLQSYRTSSHALLRGITMASTAVDVASESSVDQDFASLSNKLKDLSALNGVSGLLGWDEMVMMPAGAGDARARQKAALAAVIHERSVDPALGAVLARLEKATGALDDFQAATVREAARDYKKSTAVTEDLVRREAELESRGYACWVSARKDKNFAAFAPVLKEWIAARQERAALIDKSQDTYDVLLDDYSAGLTAARVGEIFDAVKKELIPFLADLRANGTPPSGEWLHGEYDTSVQAALCKDLAVALGFDLEKGRLDVSVHPFTGGAHPTDVRMTTRFKPHDVTEGITGAIHETGHSLYEQGRNLKFDGLPVNSAAGMAIHESQSLLWERMVGLSKPFSKYLIPKLQAAFPQFPGNKTANDLYSAMNIVKTKSLIRVEADEVTYPLHIILRFEIERGLVKGTVAVEDVPGLWNKKMEEYLGVVPEDDAQGCLQDVHWSAGLFGYFPTYTMGAIAAVQIFETAKSQLPTLEKDIESGKFDGLKSWLNEKVHSLGSLYPTADDLLVAVTGKPLDPLQFTEYIKKKYSELYNLPN